MVENRKPITIEGWKAVEASLSGYIGSVEMQVDGRTVTFQRGLLDKNRLGTMTFIDGKCKGEWFLSDNENKAPEKKYLRPTTRFVWSTKSRRQMKKIPNRTLKQKKWNTDETITLYDPVWKNASTIKRHYEKTFNEIILLKINGQVVDENGIEIERADIEPFPIGN
jgi:hypothetical protein